MPLIRGLWFSSAENGQRLGDAAFLSLVMLTTLGWTFCTASTTGVLRNDPARQGAGPANPPPTATTSHATIQRQSLQDRGTVVVLIRVLERSRRSLTPTR